MLNKVMLIGRLGADPELRYMQSGDAVANFNVATDESYTDRDGNKTEKTEWHRVVVFKRQAENCANFLSKGSLVYVEGKLQTRKWQDQQGQDRYTTEINAQRVQFLDRKGDRTVEGSWSDNEAQGYNRNRPAQRSQTAKKPEDMTGASWEEEPGNYQQQNKDRMRKMDPSIDDRAMRNAPMGGSESELDDGEVPF